MSRYFSGASANFLSANAASITAGPFTFAIWGKSTVLGAARQVLSVGQNGSSNDRYSLGANASDQPRLQVRDATTVSEGSATASIPNTTSWNLYTGTTVAGDTDRSGYLNGANRGNNHVLKTPSILPNYTRIGADPNGANTFTGFLAYAAMWSIVLSDSDILALSYLTPNLVQPASLVEYWDMLTDGPTVLGGGSAATTLTVNGNTTFSIDNPQFAAAWPYSA